MLLFALAFRKLAQLNSFNCFYYLAGFFSWFFMYYSSVSKTTFYWISLKLRTEKLHRSHWPTFIQWASYLKGSSLESLIKWSNYYYYLVLEKGGALSTFMFGKSSVRDQVKQESEGNAAVDDGICLAKGFQVWKTPFHQLGMTYKAFCAVHTGW